DGSGRRLEVPGAPVAVIVLAPGRPVAAREEQGAVAGVSGAEPELPDVLAHVAQELDAPRPLARLRARDDDAVDTPRLEEPRALADVAELGGQSVLGARAHVG